MAMFKTTIVGTIIDFNVTKKGKRFMKIYDGDNLKNVFIDDFGSFERGEEVILPCQLYTDKVYIKYVGEGEK